MTLSGSMAKDTTLARNVLVSVVIPTCRRPHALARALGSVRAQTLGSWEALVVDDGDGDGVEAAERVGDERVVALRNEGSGQAEARLTALGRARGGLVCWLDDDDWWDDPAHLALLVEAASSQHGAFFFRGGWIVREEDGFREVFDHDATPASLRKDNTILTSSLAYRRDLHERLGPQIGR